MKKARKYKNYKYVYESDNGGKYVRQQREYLAENGAPVIPLTATFLDAVIFNEIKINIIANKERRLIVKLENLKNISGYEQLTFFLPFYGDKIKTHILEIYQQAQYINGQKCFDYYGETY